MAGGRSIEIADRRLWPMLAAIALVGLALRIAAARGDYWLDEAWSALFARDAATPGRVLFAINHDNNHYLNTLWLQLVGWGAPPMLGRALSIVSGATTCVIAGLIGARRGLRTACVTALLFAISPILVTYGSEARGYAPMLLALVASVWIVERELRGRPLRHAPIWLGLIALIGMLAHLSLVFGIAALSGWVVIDAKKRLAWQPATLAMLRLMGRALVACAAVLALMLVGTLGSAGGLRMGSVAAFSPIAFVDALAHMVAFTLGWPFATVPLALASLTLLPLAAILWPAQRDRLAFLLLGGLGLPVAVAVLHPDNSAFPRYYLLSATVLLLIVADALAGRRWYKRLALYLLAASCLIANLAIVENRRGSPGDAIQLIIARLPAGAAVAIGAPRDRAVIEAAAATRDYPLRIAERCGDADFLFVQAAPGGSEPWHAPVCGARFRPLAAGAAFGLSGMAWRLYERGR